MTDTTADTGRTLLRNIDTTSAASQSRLSRVVRRTADEDNKPPVRQFSSSV